MRIEGARDEASVKNNLRKICMNFRNSLILAAVVSAGARAAMACDLCSVYAASEAQGGGGAGFFGGVAEQLTYFNTLQVEGHKVPNDGEYIYSSVSQVFLGYNISDRFTVQLNVPVIERTYGADGLGSHNEAGFGDVSLIGNAKLYQKLREDYTFTWSAMAGIKLPTGNTSHLNPNEPDFSAGIGGHDLTLGSGSVDGVVGSGMVGRWKRGFMSGSVQYAIRFEGAYAYRFANDFSWAAGPGAYLALNHNYTLAVQAVCSGETKGADIAQGMRTDDTSETLVYLGPEVHFTWQTRLSAQVGADFPLKINSSGEQLVPNFRLHAAVTIRF